ncbi:(2Fe-2S)-binding protein [Falsiroseomonas oryzae]|uniref:(2Fe-2S)-binding protein n=1 Tax=Falsiroseomonas oryzae TaxID=2766473 RepID=UPI0022EAEA57|nr:(2Fe-2S)-binding protein [Roseomonas sp. MO-31]
MLPPDEPLGEIACTVNGRPVAGRAPLRMTLVEWLRSELGLTGSHVGCAHGVCGACHVRLDGTVVRGCLVLAVQADGSAVETIEAATGPEVAALRAAFVAHAGLQCGFCTPGMILQAAELLQQDRAPSREAIRDHLSGNYCRCTGYQAIVDSVEAAAAALRAG